jgi:hypothetical protein
VVNSQVVAFFHECQWYVCSCFCFIMISIKFGGFSGVKDAAACIFKYSVNI